MILGALTLYAARAGDGPKDTAIVTRLLRDAAADKVVLCDCSKIADLATGYADGDCTMQGAPAKCFVSASFDEVNVSVWRGENKLWHWAYTRKTGKIKVVNTFLDIAECP